MRIDEAIQDALADLPKDLSETFSQILHKSGGSGQSYQARILQLIIAASRPLTADELREALSVVPGDTIWTPSRLPNDVRSALACCGLSLLQISNEQFASRLNMPGQDSNGLPDVLPLVSLNQIAMFLLGARLIVQGGEHDPHITIYVSMLYLNKLQ